MSTITLPVTDPRGPKAVAIATDAGQWLKCRTADGRKAYGIPAASEPGRYYLVTRTSCDCYDAQRRTCKHQIAVQLHCELMAEIKPPCIYCGGEGHWSQDCPAQARPKLRIVAKGFEPIVRDE